MLTNTYHSVLQNVAPGQVLDRWKSLNTGENNAENKKDKAHTTVHRLRDIKKKYHWYHGTTFNNVLQQVSAVLPDFDLSKSPTFSQKVAKSRQLF
ncbi:hypothetical protein Zmor_003002 [Zophobas morio]|uniref:Uncharacterized protein n=1 Tax=Zophobas morio TaxID=2755281 RepID=A0AA38HM32_9CUCU|nr:hypothetical protein Zmor_003002 [Zophobas morio]